MPKSLSTKQQPSRMIIVTEAKRKRHNPFWDSIGPSVLGVVCMVMLAFAIIMTPITLLLIIPQSQQEDKASAECVAMGAKPFEVRNTTLCAMPDGTVVLPKSENK